ELLTGGERLEVRVDGARAPARRLDHRHARPLQHAPADVGVVHRARLAGLPRTGVAEGDPPRRHRHDVARLDRRTRPARHVRGRRPALARAQRAVPAHRGARGPQRGRARRGARMDRDLHRRAGAPDGRTGLAHRRPPQGRIHGGARARTAQPAGADPQRGPCAEDVPGGRCQVGVGAQHHRAAGRPDGAAARRPAGPDPHRARQARSPARAREPGRSDRARGRDQPAPAGCARTPLRAAAAGYDAAGGGRLPASGPGVRQPPEQRRQVHRPRWRDRHDGAGGRPAGRRAHPGQRHGHRSRHAAEPVPHVLAGGAGTGAGAGRAGHRPVARSRAGRHAWRRGGGALRRHRARQRVHRAAAPVAPGGAAGASLGARGGQCPAAAGAGGRRQPGRGADAGRAAGGAGARGPHRQRRRRSGRRRGHVRAGGGAAGHRHAAHRRLRRRTAHPRTAARFGAGRHHRLGPAGGHAARGGRGLRPPPGQAGQSGTPDAAAGIGVAQVLVGSAVL
ncbi:MAG: Multidomain signal transduction protein including CheB-like methylesterase, CheR-like methyltransferase and BaeS-like histidine kinase, partial [uncultured Ramlibacter sp.]